MKEYKIMKRAMKIAAKKYFKRGSRHINYKGEFDYFTDNDMACEKYLISVIKKHFPNDNILSEETSSNTKLEGRTWVIDPIDGTHNYVNGYDMCGIQVAFCEGGEAKLGLIYLPYRKQFFVGIRGKGVTFNGKEIKTKKNKKLCESILTISSLRHEQPIKQIRLEIFNLINTKALDIRLLGCACGELVDVLLGKSGGYFTVKSKLTMWDYIPGGLMCEENGLPVVYASHKKIEYFIAANNEEIAKFIEEVIIKSIDKVLDKTEGKFKAK